MSDRVLGLIDIADVLGARVQTVHQWNARKLLPPPDMHVSHRPAWWQSTIMRWAESTNRI